MNKAQGSPYTTLDTVTLFFLLAVSLLIIVPSANASGQRMEAEARLDGCRQNIRDIARAVDDHAKVKKGAYPKGLQLLVPKRLTNLPQCPRLPNDPQVGPPEYAYVLDADQPNYSIYCRGARHDDAGQDKNQPSYILRKL